MKVWCCSFLRIAEYSLWFCFFKQPPPSVCLMIIHVYPLADLFIVDYKTDSIIQATLRRQMSSDITIIAVAHRLQTIMDADKIVCLM